MKLFPSIEMIDFQSKEKRQIYMDILKELKKENKGSIPDHPLIDKLAKVTMEIFGLKINFMFTSANFGPCIRLPEFVKNNPLSFYIQREYGENTIQSYLLDAQDVVSKVNLKKAKVEGFFSNILFTIYYPLSLFKDDLLTIEEHTGVLMHEIGHAFTMCLATSRTISTNMVLQYANKAIKNTQSPEEREIVYLNIKNKMGIKNIDEKEMSKTKPGFVTDVVLVTNITKAYRDELGGNIYSMTSCEQLADQFSSRMGCGTDVVTGLNKIYRKYYHISTRSFLAYFFMEVIKVLMLFFGMFAFIAKIMIMIDSSEEPTYDRPEVRFKRLKEDLIQQAKTPDLPKEVALSIRNGIETMDDVLSGYKDRYQLTDEITNFLIPSKKALVSQKDFQRQLEELSSNNLFYQAIRLQTLGD